MLLKLTAVKKTNDIHVLNSCIYSSEVLVLYLSILIACTHCIPEKILYLSLHYMYITAIVTLADFKNL